MTGERYPQIETIIQQLGNAAPAPLTYAELTSRRRPKGSALRANTTLRALAIGFAVLVAIAVPVLLLANDMPETGTPHIERGALVTAENLDGLFDTRDFVVDPGGRRVFRQDGTEWCVVRIPDLAELQNDGALQPGDLKTAGGDATCVDGPFAANGRWSPSGSRLLLYQQNDPTGTYQMLDAETLEVVTSGTLGPAIAAIVIDDERILHFSDGPEPGWNVTDIAGRGQASFAGPRPVTTAPPLLADETTVIYRSVDGDLIRLDLATGSVMTLATLPDLNPNGSPADRGVVVGVANDVTEVLILATGVANQTGKGPTTFVYDLGSSELIPHVPPGSAVDTRTFVPFIVGERWVAYTPIPDPASGDDTLDVYIAPPTDPQEAVLVFSDGTLIAAAGDRLFVRAGSTLAVLEVGP